MARFQKIDETSIEKDNGWKICLQWGRYIYDDEKMELGYRFIWRDENGHLRPQRGQACISSLDIAEELINKARGAGWGGNEGGFV